jgi:hypothetical protein
MIESLHSELRAVLPVWCICTLIPLPAIILWRFLDGYPLAHFCFFVCCMILVASRFRPKVIFQLAPLWHVKMLAVGVALVSSALVFSLLWHGFADRQDFVTLFIAFQAVIPSFCVVPYVTLLTRKPASAVILSAFLVTSDGVGVPEPEASRGLHPAACGRRAGSPSRVPTMRTSVHDVGRSDCF